MTPPVLPFGSLGALKGSSTAGMGHTARQVLDGKQRGARGRYTTAPSLGEPTCCRLQPIGSKLAEIAASTGIEATWSLKVPDEIEVAAKQVYQVVRKCRTHVVQITGPLHEHGEVMDLWAAVNMTLDKA